MVRRRIVKQNRDREKNDGTSGWSSVVKGTKYFLIRNSEDLTDLKVFDRLGAALELNRDLSAAYYLKEVARLIGDCDYKLNAYIQLDAWTASA